MRKIVTVDGPAGSGKSTIAKLLANRIGYSYLDTGALYRAVTWFFLSKSVSPKDTARIGKVLLEMKIVIDKERVLVNGEDVSDKLRTIEVTGQVANYAQNAEVRRIIRALQQRAVEKEMFIVDGRDIGTEVFPDAFCKFFLDASPTVRAARRLKDLKDESAGKSLAEVEAEMKNRDQADRTRAISPMRIPPDAFVIDSSDLTVDQVMEKMIAFFNKKIALVSDPAHKLQSEESKLFMSAIEGIDQAIDKSSTLEPGTLLKGRIIRITPSEVHLDIGHKRDGLIPADEATQLKLGELKVGETIDVYVRNARPGLSQIIVSKLEADKRSGLIKIQDFFTRAEPVTGVVKEAIKGGFIVDIFGNDAFCPYSEYDVRRVNKEDVVTGSEGQFLILEFKADQKLVVSRRKILEKKQADAAVDFFQHAFVGDLVDGVVVNITEFGAFIELDAGVTAILRPKNAAWKRGVKLGDILKRGDRIQSKIILLDPEHRKIEISKKELDADPLIAFAAAFPAGTVLRGTVRHLETFGAFVEVADGVEGLLHISEMSWTRRINHPNEILKVNEEADVKLLGIDIATRKVSLSMKDAAPNPWDNLEQRYPVGTLVKATVRSVLKAGVYLTVDAEYEGFIHIGDISWSSDRTRLADMFAEGQEIEAKVLTVNTRKKRIELGLKQKTANPWEDLKVNYGIGGVIEGEVVRINENGAGVKLNEDLEGFCHISQLSRDKVVNPEDIVKVGQKQRFLIQSIDEATKKISLSIKELLTHEEKKDVEKYTGEARSRITLGDLLQNQ
jgi:small subunit ribosomal protein S1